ncbi:hypothetical protein [Candidatus Pyrohabitans sp.]
MVALLALSAGCIGDKKDMQSPSQPALEVPRQLSYISISQVPRATPPPEFEQVFVGNLSGLIALPQATITMPNDVSNFAPEVANRVLGDIQSKFGALYVEGENTSVVVSFEAYRFSDPGYAKQVLEVYRNNWNKLRFNASGKEIWIWEGYIERGGPPDWAVRGSNIFWDSGFNEASLAVGDAVVARIAENLYCYHGEAALGNYFVMMDVHLPKERVVEEGQEIFREYLEKITVNVSDIIEEPLITGNATSGIELSDREALLVAKKEELTRAYLEHKISLELYNYTLQKIEEELSKIRNGSASQ